MNNLRTIALTVIAGAFLATPALATYKCTNYTEIGATHTKYSGSNAGSKPVFYGDVGCGPAGTCVMPSISDLGSASAYKVKDADRLWHEWTKYSRSRKGGQWNATDDFDDGFGAWVAGHGHDDGVADGHGSGLVEYLAGCH